MLSSLAFPLWIVDPGHISGLAVKMHCHYVSLRSWLDGRNLALAVKPWESMHYVAISSRNSLSGQLIGRWVCHCRECGAHISEACGTLLIGTFSGFSGGSQNERRVKSSKG